MVAKDLSIALDDPRCCVLGDSIILASIFAHYGKVRWHTNYEGKMPLILPYVEHLFELEVVPGWKAEYAMPKSGNMMRYAYDHKIPLINLDLGFEREDYCTVQTFSKNPGKTHERNHGVDVMRYVPEGQRVVNTDDITDFDELVETVAKAKNHVGISSGVAWLAAMVGTPSTLVVHKKQPIESLWGKYYEEYSQSDSRTIMYKDAIK